MLVLTGNECKHLLAHSHSHPSILDCWGCLKLFHGHRIQVLPAGTGLNKGMAGRRGQDMQEDGDSGVGAGVQEDS